MLDIRTNSNMILTYQNNMIWYKMYTVKVRLVFWSNILFVFSLQVSMTGMQAAREIWCVAQIIASSLAPTTMRRMTAVRSPGGYHPWWWSQTPSWLVTSQCPWSAPLLCAWGPGVRAGMWTRVDVVLLVTLVRSVHYYHHHHHASWSVETLSGGRGGLW